MVALICHQRFDRRARGDAFEMARLVVQSLERLQLLAIAELSFLDG